MLLPLSLHHLYTRCSFHAATREQFACHICWPFIRKNFNCHFGEESKVKAIFYATTRVTSTRIRTQPQSCLPTSLPSCLSRTLPFPLPVLVLGQVSKSSTRDICQKMPRENWISFCFDLGRLAVLFTLTRSASLHAPPYPLPALLLHTVQMRFCQSQMAYGHCLVIEKQTKKHTNG